MIAAGRARARRGVGRQGLARRCGTCCVELGYDADGLYLGLGIGEYSDESGALRPRVRRRRAAGTLLEVDLRDDYGFDVPTAAAAAERAPCSACGLSKRHLFDEAALDGGYDVVATGHNLDDEAAVLFGNVLRWDDRATSAASCPVLPGRRTASRARSSRSCASASARSAAYCVLRGIDYIVEECPMAAGNRHLGYKEVLNAIEERSPGHEGGVLLRLPRRGRRALRGRRGRASGDDLQPCARVRRARPPASVCAFCRLVERRRPPTTRSPVERRRRRRAAPMSRPFAARRPGAARRHQGAAATSSPSPRAASSTPTPASSPHDDLIGQPEGTHRAHDHAAHAYTALRPTLADFVLEDAARRAGDLPEGPRPDPACSPTSSRARACSSRASARARSSMTMLRGRRRRSYRLRAPRRLRQPGPRATCAAFLGDDVLARYDVEVRDCYDGIDETRPRPRRARPARAVAGRASTPSEALRPGGILRRLHADDHPGRAAARGARRRRRSAWPRRSRCCTAAGTSTASRCAPTTAWSPTPASSPSPVPRSLRSAREHAERAARAPHVTAPERRRRRRGRGTSRPR